MRGKKEKRRISLYIIHSTENNRQRKSDIDFKVLNESSPSHYHFITQIQIFRLLLTISNIFPEKQRENIDFSC